jgi:hypothetical protein
VAVAALCAPTTIAAGAVVESAGDAGVGGVQVTVTCPLPALTVGLQATSVVGSQLAAAVRTASDAEATAKLLPPPPPPPAPPPPPNVPPPPLPPPPP